MADVPTGNWQYADALPWTDGTCASTNHPYIDLLKAYGSVPSASSSSPPPPPPHSSSPSSIFFFFFFFFDENGSRRN
jgi:hypothetical protein